MHINIDKHVYNDGTKSLKILVQIRWDDAYLNVICNLILIENREKLCPTLRNSLH